MFDNRIRCVTFLHNKLESMCLGQKIFPSPVCLWTGVWQGGGDRSHHLPVYSPGRNLICNSMKQLSLMGQHFFRESGMWIFRQFFPAIIMLILNTGSVLNIGYEKVLAMQNQNNMAVSEVITTYSYKVSLVSTFPDYGYSTAIGLFQSLVGLVLILVTNKIADKVTGMDLSDWRNGNMKKKKITQDKVVYFFNYVFLTLMLLIVLYPLIYIVSCSFSSGNALVSGKVKFLPVEPTLQSYKAVFEYRAIWVGYKNSIIYTVLGTLLSVALTLLAAYPLSREDLRGGKVFMALFLFTMMFQAG